MKESNLVKSPYVSPKLTIHGSLEELTLGSGIGLNDIFVFGLNDPIGNCGSGSCNTGSGTGS